MIDGEDQENDIPLNESDIPQGEVTKKVSGMYMDWFMDYASYVILERAVPAIEDGLKPVQRRILHSMKELDDGRYNKVANIVGQNYLLICKVTGVIYLQVTEQQPLVI